MDVKPAPKDVLLGELQALHAKKINNETQEKMNDTEPCNKSFTQ